MIITQAEGRSLGRVIDETRSRVFDNRRGQTGELISLTMTSTVKLSKVMVKYALQTKVQ